MSSFSQTRSEAEDIFKSLNAEPPCLPQERPLTVQDSFKAYKLASTASAVYSQQDLVVSGTWQKYERRAAALARAHHKRDPFAKYLERLRADDWPSRNSRQANRSALVRLASRDILHFAPIFWREQGLEIRKDSGAVKTFNEIVKPLLSADDVRGLRGAASPLSKEEHHQLKRAVQFLLEVPPDPYHKKSAQTLSPDNPTAVTPSSRKKEHSVKKTLTALNRHTRRKAKTRPDYDWRNQFWTTVLSDRHLDDHQRACIATLMLTGCRPAEFSEELGVDLALKDGPQGGALLTITIAGAKTMQPVTGELVGKGQNFRCLELDCVSPEGQWVMERLECSEQRSMRFALPSPTHSENGILLPGTERNRRISARLGKLITRIGKAAFPNLRHNLTPYVFRHAFASDMKAADHFGAEAIAQALGHQSTRTQESYGLVSSTKGLSILRAQHIISVSATSPIRCPDRNGLTNDPNYNGKIN